jgi:hypothetical protein
LPGLHAGFLALLPRLEAHARFAFRHYRCPHDRADALAEALALCWAWYRRLSQRGKDAAAFPTALAAFASRQVKAGRHLRGQENTRDALSPTARRRRGFAVERLPEFSTGGALWQEALADNTRSPVPEQAAFRIDFPAWLAALGDRDRRLAEAMATGERTFALARAFGLTPGRVSQLRRAFHDDWGRFCGAEAPAAAPAPGAA